MSQGKDRRKEVGRLGEQWACRYLSKKGYTIIETNWRSRLGELDVIATCEELLVIVEVALHGESGLVTDFNQWTSGSDIKCGVLQSSIWWQKG